MTELSWFEAFPPADLDAAQLTAAVRLLAGRSRRGWQRLTPVIVFETWVSHDRVRWLLGTDIRLNRSVPRELRAQLPGLHLVRLDELPRPILTTAVEARFASLAFPLRTDTAASLSTAVHALSSELSRREHAVVQWVLGPSMSRMQRPAAFTPLEAIGMRSPAPANAGDQAAWRAKVEEPLFGVRARFGATAATAQRAGGIIRSVRSAVAVANGSHAQLTVSRQSSRTAAQLLAVLGRARTWPTILNAAELAAVLAWPVNGAATPGAPLTLAPPPDTLIAPDCADANQDDESERRLGTSLHPAALGRPVRLPLASCATHVHVIGPTGSGKSTVLAQWIGADIRAGHSVLLIEPRGDLVTDVLARIPADRHDDVVVIEPSDGLQVVGLNPLAGARDDAERRADELLALFRSLFGSSIGARSADVLLHALITAARLPDGTLTDVPALLTNPGFRRQALAQVSDPLVLAPFWAGFDARSEPDRQQVVAPLLNKLRALISRPALRRLLSHPSPQFDLSEVFTGHRIVLVNLNHGLLGPETAALVGSLLLTQLWQAVNRRAAVPAAQRRAVMVVVDEWQTYAGALDFGDVLATSRGLGVGWTLAHQLLPQLSPALKAAVLANARSRLVFRPADGDARELAAVLGADVTPDGLAQLGAFQAAARVLVEHTPSRTFAVQTTPLSPAITDPAQLRATSAARYGVAAADLDAAVLTRWQRGDQAPVGTKRRTRS